MKCPECKGKGRLEAVDLDLSISPILLCPICKGTGEIKEHLLVIPPAEQPDT